MKKKLIFAAAAILMGTTATFAVTADEIVQQMKDAGFVRVTLQHGLNRVKIRAYGDNGEWEVVINPNTGAILKDKSESGSDDKDHSGEADDEDHDGNDNHDGNDEHDGGDDHDGGDNHDSGDKD